MSVIGLNPHDLADANSKYIHFILRPIIQLGTLNGASANLFDALPTNLEHTIFIVNQIQGAVRPDGSLAANDPIRRLHENIQRSLQRLSELLREWSRLVEYYKHEKKDFAFVGNIDRLRRELQTMADSAHQDFQILILVVQPRSSNDTPDSVGLGKIIAKLRDKYTFLKTLGNVSVDPVPKSSQKRSLLPRSDIQNPPDHIDFGSDEEIGVLDELTREACQSEHDEAESPNEQLGDARVSHQSAPSATLQRRVLEPRRKPRLITWKCSCGTRLSDYYNEIVPGSIEHLERQLNHDHPLTPSMWGRVWDKSIHWLVVSSSSRGNSAASAATSTNLAVLPGSSATTAIEAQSNSSKIGSASNSNQSSLLAASTPGQAVTRPQWAPISYLLLCFPEGLSGLKLHHQQLLRRQPHARLPNHVENDKQLFQLLRQKYNLERRLWISAFWPKTVIRVSLAYFHVDLSNYVDLRHYACQGNDTITCKCIPPKDDFQYDCFPRPSPYVPPIGTNYLTHYFQHPECVREGNSLVLNQVPKRLGQCMVTSGTDMIEAWGMEFEEGWDRGRLRNAIFILIVIGSLTFAVLWSVLKKDMQSAFGVSAFVVSTLAVVSGYIASAEPRIVHK